MNKFISIACYVLAGFFASMVMLISFVGTPPLSAKIAVMGLFSFFGVVCLFIAFSVSRYARWQHHMGVTLISAALSTTFLQLNTVCMLATPEITSRLSTNNLDVFSDYIFGVLCVLAFLGLGGWLLRLGRMDDVA